MMSHSQYSLSWGAHVRNVCDGLSNLQQNGEFVDMTLAADGHLVKVHQVVLALASPYFKDLIISAQCPHPVIFLSKVTHATLSAILEYIYTGEVLVSLEHLHDLIEAATELHIKGLKDMKIHPALAETSKQLSMAPPPPPQTEDVLEGEDMCLFQGENGNPNDQEEQQQQGLDNQEDMMQFPVDATDYDNEQLTHQPTEQDLEENQVLHLTHQAIEQVMEENQDLQLTHQAIQQDMEENQDLLSGQDQDVMDGTVEELETLDESETKNFQTEEFQEEEMPYTENNDTEPLQTGNGKIDPTCTALQYTVSNQGSLQMILNRFVYYLKHTNKDRSRQWRCVDYLNPAAKCPALVFTKDDIVAHRIAAHTHPFHDKKIFKKLKSGDVFSAFKEAKKEGDLKKKKTAELNK